MPTPTTPVTGPNASDDTALRWIVSRLDALARAINVAARSADPIAALAPHRVEIAELLGVARLDAAPPLGAVLDVVGQLAGATPATAPPTTLIQPTLELASRAVQEGAAALGAGLAPAVDGATVLALAALVRAARPAAAVRPTAQPIGTLLASGAPSTPRPAVIARFRGEAIGAAEHLRAALARVRSARDPIASDAATWEAMRFAEHLETLATEYGLTAVADCLETARRGVPTLDARALWVLDEAGVELAEPGTPVEGVLPRFLALRARLDGMQPPPTAPSTPTVTRPSGTPAAGRSPAVAPVVPSPEPATDTQGPRGDATPTAAAGATLADLLRDGIAAFAAPVSLPDAAELAYRGPSARAAARALRDALERGERAATPAAMDELHDLLRLAEE